MRPIPFKWSLARSLILTLVIMFAEITSSQAAIQYLTGQVISADGTAIVGASVVVLTDSQAITGAATDTNGFFMIKLSNYSLDSVSLKASAIGFDEKLKRYCLRADTLYVDFSLTQREVAMAGITVSPERTTKQTGSVLKRHQLEEGARKSLVATNPVAAIQKPQVIREGSQHSSKLRVNGTSPNYYINGIEIGANPNHFSSFSIIPAPVVKELKLHAQGTPAAYGLPSTVQFATGSPFERHLRGEVELSAIDATGSWSLGTDRFFVLGSLRKSVLDKLVRYVDTRYDRRTIPPTNFQDVFISSGLKIHPGHNLIIDQYHVRDFLAYNTEASAEHVNSIDTYLHTDKHYIGARYDIMSGNLLLRIRGAIRTSFEEYSALPTTENVGTKLNLTARHRNNLGSIEVNKIFGETQFSLGSQIDYISRSEVKLSHKNWNFLPPDANSDNPYLYQSELNKLYGKFDDSHTELNGNAYASLVYTLGPAQMESGFRVERFSNLNQKNASLVRQKITLQTGENSRLSLFFGTFAETPMAKILEPYQVLIRDNPEQIDPIETQLISVTFKQGSFKAGLFGKRMDHLPVVSPDFDYVNADKTVNDGFIAVHSIGRINFYGGDLSLELNGLMAGKLSLYSFYGYTHATKQTSGIEAPYELNAPHRFFTRGSYKLSKVLTVGADIGIRSGYAYTPAPASVDAYGSNRYSTEYYENALRAENSSRFPMNVVLNLHLGLDFGKSELYLSVANVSNRANPIINTMDGYIYDTGILPSIGFTRKF
ncbi:MAG: hypothetical protein DRP47_02075 [Candidatus Zixiibacteriota bacterium]|nr:MAG: hypothetical protein DRP47_02075 [candidate division Zixibacteria bacterium]